MNDFIFIAHDPGGLDAVYPVALELSKRDKISIRLALSGQAGNKQPLFKMRDDEIMNLLYSKVNNGDGFVLVTGTSWNATLELESIAFCKSNGIKTVSILDYWCNYMDRFKYKDTVVFPDRLFVMDQLAFNEAVKEGVDPSIIRITGNPGLDHYVHKKLNNKKVLFISQPLSLLYNISETGYDEFAAFKNVIDACEELSITPYIKFHPKETERMRELYQEYSVGGNIEEIVSDYNAVIGMTTMGLLQCSLMGIPVISFQPNLSSEDLCIINKIGIAHGVFTYKELIDQLKMITGTVDKKNLPFWYDGKSTERCVKELLEIKGDIDVFLRG